MAIEIQCKLSNFREIVFEVVLFNFLGQALKKLRVIIFTKDGRVNVDEMVRAEIPGGLNQWRQTQILWMVLVNKRFDDEKLLVGSE